MAKKSFETSIKQLEDIVQNMESSELPLEKALKMFEEGMKLSKQCSTLLDETEKRITILLKDHEGNITESDFDEEDK